MNIDPRKNFGANSPKMSATDLAKKLGVELAANAPAPAAAVADPFGLMRGLVAAGFIDGAALCASATGGGVPGGSKDYRLDLSRPAQDAPRPRYRPREWMRTSMPEVALEIDWLRSWVPVELFPFMFINLWSGKGWIVDEAAGLALGAPPTKRWQAALPDEYGVRRVRRRG